MANEANNLLQELLTNIQQRPEWDQAGQERQYVIAFFTTPHGFTGQEKMTLAEWENEKIRNDKLFNAIARLEGPFWESPEEEKKKGK